jgi:hypothetical protein
MAADFNDDFSTPADALNTTKWSPFAISFNHAGEVAVANKAVSISYLQGDAKVGDSRFGIISNAVFGPQSSVEAELDSFDGVNAIMRLVGRNGGWVEWAIDNNADNPLHVWRSYPDGDKAWDGGKGAATPITLGVTRNGDNLEFYTVSGGVKTVQVSRTAGGLGDSYRLMLYGFAGSNTTWKNVKGTGATPMALVTGKVSGTGAAGARVSSDDTLFPPVIAGADGSYSYWVLPGSYTLTAANLASTPATKAVTVAVAGATADLALTPATDPPIYDNFDGPAVDTAKWTPVTVEGQGPPSFSFEGSDLIIDGSDIQSWRRQGIMSTTAFSSTYSVMKVKMDPVPTGKTWYPIVSLWDGAGTPNWNTQPHLDVEFRADVGRLQLNGGRAPWVSREADQFLFSTFDAADLPAIFSVVRTGNTYDFYIKGKSDTTDRLCFSATTSNMPSNHRVVVYAYSPNPMGQTHNTVALDYVASSNPVTTGTLSGTVSVGGTPAANAGVMVAGAGNTLTAKTDAAGKYTLPLNPGDYTVVAAAYGADRSAPKPVTMAAGGAQTVDVALAASSLFPPPVYDDFNGTDLDQSKWQTATEEGTGEGTTSEAGGELVLTGPGAGNRWGIRSKASFPAAATVTETVVKSIDSFGPGGINAIQQLYTGDGGFNHFIEYGIETLSAGNMPMLHVWGPESGDVHGASPADFPITLTTVRRGNDMDFYVNHQWYTSITTQRLTGDHKVVLYGYGASVPHFDSIAIATAPAAKKGDVNSDGKINIADVVQVLRWVVGLGTPTADQTTLADVNKDNKLNVQDVVLMLRYVVGIITQFPA